MKDVRAVQFWKAWAPMLATLSGSTTSVRFGQSMNAPEPMAVTVSGTTIFRTSLLPSKARSPISVTGRPFISAGISATPSTTWPSQRIITA